VEGQTLGRYVVENRLGAGGMAEVFRARQVGTAGFSRTVALKRMLPTWSADPDFAEMFVAEAKTSSILSHPNIVTVLDFDRDPSGALYLVMEFIDGADTSQLLKEARRRGRTLPASASAYICGEVLRALDHAHRLEHEGKWLGIVHRDVSPHNCLVSRTGAVKLSDFGIAKATAASTHSGNVKGKIAYMSPEQATGLQLDGRSDLFAVGVMLYELLAGARPFSGHTEPEILAQVLTARPQPVREVSPHVPADLAAVTMRLLAKERDKRYPSAADALKALVACDCYPADGPSLLAEEVRDLLSPNGSVSQPVAGQVSTPRTTSGSRIRLSKRTLAILAAGAVLAVAAAVIVWQQPRGERAAAGSVVDAGMPARPDAALAVVSPPDAGVAVVVALPADAGTFVADPVCDRTCEPKLRDARGCCKQPEVAPRSAPRTWKVDKTKDTSPFTVP
jgi:eukaryotic-like serine/threonine-protein kinase